MSGDEFNKEALTITHKHIFESLKRIEAKVEYTNGKVKRLTLALIAVAFFCLGLGLEQAEKIVGFLL